jgi:hypothetical protein
MAINPSSLLNKIKLDDREWKRIMKEFKILEDAWTAIGFFSEDKYSDGTNIAQIAFWNEFGVPKDDGTRIPERSFLRAWVDKNKAKIDKFKLVLLRKIIDRQIDAKKAIKLLGEFATGEIKKFIVALKDPPNAPSTIAAKGSSNPLIDTGRMLGAVQHKEYFSKSAIPRN